MKTIDADIKKGQLGRVYLLYGEEDYLKQQYKRKLKEALVAPDDTMNFAYYEGKDVHPPALIDLAETMPFFAERRLILVEDSGLFQAKAGQPGREELAAYIPDIPATACLVFVETQVDKRSKLYKAVKKAGSTAEFSAQREPVLTRWVLGRLNKEKKQITKPVLHLFFEKAGTDMGNIDRELEKLLCYTLDKPAIEAADVEAICTDTAVNQIFEMIAAIGRREQKQALLLYDDLVALKEPPMRILYLMNRQFRILMELKAMGRAGLDAKTMASKAGIPPFAVKRNLGQAASFSDAELRQALEFGIQLETDIKTGKLADRIAVELMIVTYSGKA